MFGICIICWGHLRVEKQTLPSEFFWCNFLVNASDQKTTFFWTSGAIRILNFVYTSSGQGVTYKTFDCERIEASWSLPTTTAYKRGLGRAVGDQSRTKQMRVREGWHPLWPLEQQQQVYFCRYQFGFYSIALQRMNLQRIPRPSPVSCVRSLSCDDRSMQRGIDRFATAVLHARVHGCNRRNLRYSPSSWCSCSLSRKPSIPANVVRDPVVASRAQMATTAAPYTHSSRGMTLALLWVNFLESDKRISERVTRQTNTMKQPHIFIFVVFSINQKVAWPILLELLIFETAVFFEHTG